ncbi:MAG TPA: ABC transporter permease [bacterium]|jgi:simple sugar transport system permease protein
MIAPRLELRTTPSRALAFLVPVLSVVSAFVVAGLVLYAAGANPLHAYVQMMLGAFGSVHNVAEVLVKATPLMLTGLGVMVAFRVGFWNIGAEGQLYMGAFAATLAVLQGWELPGVGFLPTMALAAAAAGGLWALLPAVLKLRLHTNEILTTLLLNYVAILFVAYFLYGPWKDPLTLNFPMTKRFPDAAQLPRFFDTRLHWGFVLAVVLAVCFYILIERTRWGFAITVVGENPRAAAYAGIDVLRTVLIAAVISGGLAGLAGMVEVAGIQLRLVHGISPPNAPYGYTAIIVAWLARRRPLGVVVVAALLGALYVGGEALQIGMKVPTAIVLVVQAMILLFILGGQVLSRYRVVLRREERADVTV